MERAHNPEVAGSNPAPATTKALLSGAFCLQDRRDDADFIPLFIPIAKVRHGETFRFRPSALSVQTILCSALERYGDCVRVGTAQEFRDRMSEMLCSEDVLLVRHEGRPVGLFLPWQAEIPDDVQREVFLRVSEQVAVQREAQGFTEEDIVRDFAAERRRR